MRYYRAIFDTNYVDGDGTRERLYTCDHDDTSEEFINSLIEADANDYYADHEYLAQGFDYEEGFIDEEDEQDYYDNCSTAIEKISKEEYDAIIAENPDIEIMEL